MFETVLQLLRVILIFSRYNFFKASTKNTDRNAKNSLVGKLRRTQRSAIYASDENAVDQRLPTYPVATRPSTAVMIFPQAEYCDNGDSPDKFNRVIHMEFGTVL